MQEWSRFSTPVPASEVASLHKEAVEEGIVSNDIDIEEEPHVKEFGMTGFYVLTPPCPASKIGEFWEGEGVGVHVMRNWVQLASPSDFRRMERLVRMGFQAEFGVRWYRGAASLVVFAHEWSPPPAPSFPAAAIEAAAALAAAA